MAGVALHDWGARERQQVYRTRVEGVAEYQPGSFYRRELPCILALLREHGLALEVIVIDGFVHLDGVAEPGLGQHLHDALRGEVAVIGVAKRAFRDIGERFALHRTREAIARMHGEHRLPALLKLADQVCRGRP